MRTLALALLAALTVVAALTAIALWSVAVHADEGGDAREIGTNLTGRCPTNTLPGAAEPTVSVAVVSAPSGAPAPGRIPRRHEAMNKTSLDGAAHKQGVGEWRLYRAARSARVAATVQGFIPRWLEFATPEGLRQWARRELPRCPTGLAQCWRDPTPGSPCANGCCVADTAMLVKLSDGSLMLPVAYHVQRREWRYERVPPGSRSWCSERSGRER